MLPVPYNSDAPLYHWPIGTGLLILLNFVLYFTVPMRLYRPTGDHFLEVEAQHKALAERDGAVNGVEQDAEAENPAEAAVEPLNPKWAENDKQWKQGEFNDPDDVQGGVGFQVVELERDGTSQFPEHTLALQHGKFKPWQWFTAPFLHHDLIQLVFNMFALWAFGLIVEGKVGSVIFLVLYLLMGACQAGFEQFFMILSSSGSGSIGSTGAIFAALGIAVIWAPRNDFDCFWAYGLRFGTVEIPVMMYGFIILVVHLLYGLLLSYFSMSAIFQLAGLPIGAVVGFVLLQAKWVDCEGWDIVNVWKGNEGHIDQHAAMDDEASQLVRKSLNASGKENAEPTPSYLAPQPPPLSAAPDADQFAGFFSSLNAVTSAAAPAPLVESLTEVMKLVDRDQFTAAGQMYQRVRQLEPHQLLPQAKLDRLMRGLLADRQYELSIPVMTEHAKRFSENRIAVQLNLAKVLIHLQRPTKAIAVLRAMDRSGLDEAQKSTFHKLASHAKKQLDDGVVELQ